MIDEFGKKGAIVSHELLKLCYLQNASRPKHGPSHGPNKEVIASFKTCLEFTIKVNITMLGERWVMLLWALTNFFGFEWGVGEFSLIKALSWLLTISREMCFLPTNFCYTSLEFILRLKLCLAHLVSVTRFRALRVTIAVLLALAFIETPSSLTYVRFSVYIITTLWKIFDASPRSEKIV